MPGLEGLNVSFLAGTLGQGGAEQQLVYMIRALQQSGANPRLLCLTHGEFWEQKLRKAGVPMTWVGQRASRFARLCCTLREVRQHPPDVLQSGHLYTNLYAVAAARALGLREVGALRGDAYNEVHGNGLILGRLSLRAPRIVAANSQAAIQNAMKLGMARARLCLLPSVVDTDRFTPPPRRREGPIQLIAAGRLVEEKRIDRFLSILFRLQKAGQRIKAAIVGDGPQKKDLERQASQLGLLPDVVEFRGAASDLAPAYREGDILVLTSDSEGTPSVVLEAMASGLPVVATRVGGVPEIVQQGETGFLADPEDEESMVEALSSLIWDADLRLAMGCRGREYVVAERSHHRLPALLAELYTRALA